MNIRGQIFTPQIQIGGTVFTDLDNLIVLRGFISSGKKASLRQNFDTAGYAVPAAKKLRLLAIQINQETTTAALDTFNYLPSYGDNDVGMDSATAVTNEVKLANINARVTGQVLATAQDRTFNQSIWLEIPTGKYVIASSDGTIPRAYFTVYGYLFSV